LSIPLVIKSAIIIQKTNFFFGIYSSVITMYYLNINYRMLLLKGADKMKSEFLPPTYFWLSVLLSLGLHFIIPIKKIIGFPYRFFGIIFILFGIVLNLWSDSMFKKKKTTVKPYKNPTELATMGPFRISRHPMYLGIVAILLGEAIILGSLITFLFPMLFIIISEWLFIPFEEANLENVFGRKYRDYKKKVRRWI